MPHIALDYSANIQISDVELKELFNTIHLTLSEIANINNCKSHANKASCFYVADGNEGNAFVSLKVALLKTPARTDEVKQDMIKKLILILEEVFLPILHKQGLNGKPTAEIRNLETYLVSEK